MVWQVLSKVLQQDEELEELERVHRQFFEEDNEVSGSADLPQATIKTQPQL